MSARLALALDVGTHAVKAALVNRSNLTLVKVSSRDIALQTVTARQFEQRAEEILAALEWAIDEVLRDCLELPQVAGLACQRSTVVAWDRSTLLPLGPALSWQDTRAVEITDRLLDREEEIKRISGLVLSPHYGASKMRWLIQHYGLNPQQHCVGPLISFLTAHLLGQSHAVCDHSNGNRTQLMNMDILCWDSNLLSYFELDKHFLPQLKPMHHPFGLLKKYPIELTAMAGDQNAAVLASLDVGQGKIIAVNLGSGAFVLRQFGDRSKTPQYLLSSVLYSNREGAALIAEGTVNGAGLALTRFCQSSEMVNLGGEGFLFSTLSAWLDDIVDPGCLYLNSCGGLGSPYWCEGPQAQFVAVDSEPNQAFSLAERAVAVVESIVFLVCKNCLLLQSKGNVNAIYLSGGLARLNAIGQKMADVCQLPVIQLDEQEATLVGVARMASGLKEKAKVSIKMQFQPHARPLLQRRMKMFHQLLKTECSA